jgi:hypothetical protein
VKKFLGKDQFETVSSSEGKVLLTNVAARNPSGATQAAPVQPIPSSPVPPAAGRNVP